MNPITSLFNKFERGQLRAPRTNPSFETEDDISLFLRALSASGNLKDFSEGHWIDFGRHEGMSDLEIVDLIEQAAGWVQDTTDGGRHAPERAAWARL